jgi:peptidoglycan lytic transglycosylase G
MGHLPLKRSNIFSLRIWILLVLVGIGMVGAYCAYFLVHPLKIAGRDQVFVIPIGASTHKIAEALEHEGIVKHPLLFTVTVYWEGKRGKLQAGEYLIKPNMAPLDLIDLFVSGKVIQHAFTVVPGWTFDQLMAALKAEPNIEHTVLELDKDALMAKIGCPYQHPEGCFLPETYHFPKGTTDIAFLKRAHQLLEEKLARAWANRAPDLILKTPYEALILASIIEKESGLEEEYGDIAGVYVRRLGAKQLLQADPTVIYGLGKGFVGNLTAEQLKADSPYNTYQQLGLPPTPIALPSLKALEAAVHPKPGNTLYFVAKPEGKGHVFSTTLEDHQTAVLEYKKAVSKLGNTGTPSP